MRIPLVALAIFLVARPRLKRCECRCAREPAEGRAPLRGLGKSHGAAVRTGHRRQPALVCDAFYVFASLALRAALGASLLPPCVAIAQTLKPTIAASAEKGRALIAQKGCGGCHTIPGVDNADGVVGQPLNMMGRRIFIAGILQNTPESLAAWVLDPQRYVPGNAMPATALTPQDAADVAAYLESLR
jgi:cytochrome c